MEPPTSSIETQTPETSKGRRREKKLKPMTQTPATRCTRSQAAPDWSVGEMLIMVKEIIAIEEDSLKALSSYQKWKIISENCANGGVVRPSNQCKRQWESVFGQYSKIKDWESESQDNSYWDLSDEQKKEFELPVGFDKEIYGVIRDFLIAREEKSDSESLSESDAPVKKLGRTTQAAFVKTRPKIKVQGLSHSLEGSDREGQGNPPASKIEREQEITAKLKENCEHIDAILQGKIAKIDDGFSSLDVERGSVTQTGFRRQQGDELVKVLGGLVNTLNLFVDLCTYDKLK
ncbi:trihelix transcription factor ASR3 [Nymphaea colorata]|nr:trihelix transcription factor ASR3 [Nymphaea colorata]